MYPKDVVGDVGAVTFFPFAHMDYMVPMPSICMPSNRWPWNCALLLALHHLRRVDRRRGYSSMRRNILVACNSTCTFVRPADIAKMV